MKKFTKLLSIISSILGVLTITLGVSLGILDKPRTISSVSAGDLPTEEYLDNVYVCDSFINISNDSKGTVIFHFNSYLTYRCYVYVNAERGFDFYVGDFEFNSPVYSLISSDGTTLLKLGVLTGLILFENDYYFIGNYKVNDINTAKFTLTMNFGILPATYYFNFEYFINDNTPIVTSFSLNDFYYGYGERTSPALSAYYNDYEINLSELYNTSDGYDLGYEKGYNYGYDSGKNEILDNLSEFGLYDYQQYSTYGVEQFNAGVAYASSNDLNFYDFLTTLFKAPTSMFSGIWNWSLPLGNGTSLNLLPLMTFLLTIAIALAVIKLILGGK